MKEKHSANFLIGFWVGALIAAAIWYWQKSTAADDGALDLLDRLAELERSPGKRATAVSQPDVQEEPDDLQQVRGIGPVFDGRLRQMNIDTFAKLTAISAEKLAEILDIGENRAEAIMADVRSIG